MLKTFTPPESSLFDRLEVDDSEGGNSIGSVKIAKKSENQKVKNCLSPENWLSPKNRQKVGIYLILTLKIAGRAF